MILMIFDWLHGNERWRDGGIGFGMMAGAVDGIVALLALMFWMNI